MKVNRRRRLLWHLAYDDPWDWRLMRWLPWLIPAGVGVVTAIMLLVRSE